MQGLIILTLFIPFPTAAQDKNTIEKKMKEILKSMQSAERALHDSTQENSKVKSDLNTAKKHEKEAIKKLNQLIKSITEKDFENDSNTTIPIPDDFRDEKEGGIPSFGEDQVERPNDFVEGTVPTFGGALQNQNGPQGNGYQSGNGQNPANDPYLPDRTDPPSVFKDELSRAKRWGDLPPRMRESIEKSKSMIDDCPPKWRHILKEYYKTFENLK